MTYVGSQFEGASKGGMVVGRPRITDAIGSALRNAFCPYAGLPADWEKSLRALDENGGPTSASTFNDRG